MVLYIQILDRLPPFIANRRIVYSAFALMPDRITEWSFRPLIYSGNPPRYTTLSQRHYAFPMPANA